MLIYSSQVCDKDDISTHRNSWRPVLQYLGFFVGSLTPLLGRTYIPFVLGRFLLMCHHYKHRQSHTIKTNNAKLLIYEIDICRRIDRYIDKWTKEAAQ